MNITNTDPTLVLSEAQKLYGTSDPVELIFARQRELFEKYRLIEADILGREPLNVLLNLDSARDQTELKQRAWWVTEELAEFSEANNQGEPTKAIEELADALHFLTELLILVGIKPDLIHRELLDSSLGNFRWDVIVENLGMSMWQLRNKPWKQTQVPTDRIRFLSKLIFVWEQLINFTMRISGLDLEQVATLYLQKSTVNLFRIKTQY